MRPRLSHSASAHDHVDLGEATLAPEADGARHQPGAVPRERTRCRQASASKSAERSAVATAAAVGPFASLAFGATFGGVAAIGSVPVALAYVTWCVVLAVVLFGVRRRALRLSRWTIGIQLLGGATFACGFGVLGVGMAAARLDACGQLWFGLALACAAAAVWAHARARTAARWERARRVNESEVLDLTAATYDVERGFSYPEPQSDTSGLPPAADRANGVLARALPIAAPVGVVLGRMHAQPGHGDPRMVLLLVFAPAIFLGWVPAIAQVCTTWQKLRAYERQIGRDIVNR